MQQIGNTIEKGEAKKSRIVVYSRQGGTSIKKGVVRRSRIVVHNRHEKKYKKKRNKGEKRILLGFELS